MATSVELAPPVRASMWTPMCSTTVEDLEDVWGSDPDDVFVLGAQRTILHYDGIE